MKKLSLMVAAMAVILAGCSSYTKQNLKDDVADIKAQTQEIASKVKDKTKELAKKTKEKIKAQRKVSACWNTERALSDYKAFGHHLEGKKAVRAKALAVAIERHCEDTRSTQELVQLLKPVLPPTRY